MLPADGPPTPRGTDLGSVGYVFTGGAIGSLLAWMIQLIFSAYADPYPWPTQIINITGSFALGLLTARLQRTPDERLRLLIGVGLCGGFTTFSAFSVEAVRLLAAGSITVGLAYVFGSVAACTAAAMAGLALGRGRRLDTPPEE